tara:strand:- start:233 stop:1285 length:1053 start_codon:yes stop_codon:yes gene_type:complete
MNSFKFENYKISEKSKPFFVAEVGINFNGSIELAKKTIIAAKKAGADSVKFQYYKTEDFISNRKIHLFYKNKGKRIKINQFELFKKNEFSFKQLSELKQFCDKSKINFHVTPTNVRAIDELMEIGVKIIKNGSDFLTHTNILKKISKHKLPVIISTGMSKDKEISYALSFFKKYNKNNLIVLHCTSNYPTEIKDANVKRLKNIKNKYKCLVGFSDHTTNNLSAIFSRYYGAVWFEKHFTLNKKLSGPDHNFSADEKEFNNYIRDVNNVEKLLGSGKIDFEKKEALSRKNFGISCVSKRDIKKGEILKYSDLDFKRPGNGIKPYQVNKILGKKTKKKLYKDDIILIKNIEK